MDEALTANLASLLLESSESARPDFGSAGLKVEVTTNHFQILAAPNTFYEYRIEYSKLRSRTVGGLLFPAYDLKWRTEKCLAYKSMRNLAPLNRIAYEHAVSDDFETLWATKDAKATEIRIPDVAFVSLNGENEVLDYVKLHFVRKIDFNEIIADMTENPKALLQILHAFVRMPARVSEGLLQTGTSRFSRTDSSEVIDEILEVKRGFHVEVRVTQKGCFVNVNTATTSFYRPINLATLLRKVRGNVKMFVNLQVEVEKDRKPSGEAAGSQIYATKMIKSFGISLGRQRYSVLKWNGKGESGFEYHNRATFRRNSEVSLPHVNIGLNDTSGACWVPAEWLNILPNQVAHQDIAQLANAKIIRVAAQPADVNRDRIVNISLSTLGLSRDTFLVNAGFNFSEDLLNIEARILPNPSVIYGPNNNPRVDEASWNLSTVRKLRKNGVLKQLHVLSIHNTNPQGNENIIKRFADNILIQMKFHGFSSSSATFRVCRRDRMQQDLEGIFKLYAQNGVRIILVVLPEDDKGIYQMIKRLGTLQYGIATVCCLFDLIARDSKQVASNIILKLNIKSGGINQALGPKELLTKLVAKKGGVIAMGADVMHSSGLKGFPSTASVVSSIDNDFSIYLASMRLQRSLQERIEDMQVMVEERLEMWKSKNASRTPSTILFFRDGVGDSQFDEIASTEIPAIQKAWTQAFGDTPLALNFIIVSKRHQQRLYPKKDCPKTQISKFGQNVKPGIVVDTSICDPIMFDFYLGAHAAIKGTMRPAHYYVLKNDSNFNADEMQGLTLALSYLHPICTRGVSYAAPGYDADRACESAKQLIDYEVDAENMPRKGEGKHAFRDRCLQYALRKNPKWNQPGRPGPWHPNLDGVPHYL